MRAGNYVLIGFAIALAAAVKWAGDSADVLAEGLSSSLLFLCLFALLLRLLASLRRPPRPGNRSATPHAAGRSDHEPLGEPVPSRSAEAPAVQESRATIRRRGRVFFLLGVAGAPLALIYATFIDAGATDLMVVGVAAVLALVGLYEWLSGRSFRSLGARWDAMGPSVTDALGVAIVGVLLGGCALAFWRLMGS